MFRSNFFISIRQTEDGLYQPVMHSRRVLDQDEGLVWAAGCHYSERHQAEQAARRCAEAEGTGYDFVVPEEAAV